MRVIFSASILLLAAVLVVGCVPLAEQPVPSLVPAVTSSPQPLLTPPPEATATVPSTPSPVSPGVTASAEATPVMPTRTPTSPSPTLVAPLLTVRLLEEVDMLPGQTVELEGTDILVTLLEAHGPREGCDDCPVQATLQVSRADESQTLQYSFSGNMLMELREKARRKEAFGYIFAAARVAEGEFTLRIEPLT